ncbi:MAG TPA: DUF4097 family beta strand repeat-containing protein [Opitutus sp.]|nr:DUF4097 family beta strand repeat-containing protein [Opitutus sp.]
MKAQSFLLVTAGLLALAPISAHAKIERVVEKTFTVSPGGLLNVSTQGGDIRVETAAGNVVKVIAKERIRADSESEADELLKPLQLTIEQDGGGVTATAKYERKLADFHWHSWPPVQVSFVVTVPASYNAELHTSGGDIKVADLGGKLNAHTSGGNLVLGKITGEINAQTSGGNVRLEEGGAATKLGTSGGNISVEHIVGPAELRTSGGDISIGTVDDTLEARTSGGNVSAQISGGLKGDCVLSTSGGRVRATVPKSAAFDLEASTSGGDVRADGLTITIDGGGVGKSRLSGRVNGGGPKLKLHSSGGDIVVETR